MSWTALNQLTQLSQLDELSQEQACIIFKHSTRCSISHMVLSRFERENDIEEKSYFFLDLISYRDLSNAIEERYQVKHESPQLLVIKKSQCVAHASHQSINQLALKDFCNE